MSARFPGLDEFRGDEFIIQATCPTTEQVFYIILELALDGTKWKPVRVSTELLDQLDRLGSKNQLDVSRLSQHSWEPLWCPRCFWNEWPAVVQCLKCHSVMCGRPVAEKSAQEKVQLYVCPTCGNMGSADKSIQHVIATIYKGRK